MRKERRLGRQHRQLYSDVTSSFRRPSTDRSYMESSEKCLSSNSSKRSHGLSTRRKVILTRFLEMAGHDTVPQYELPFGDKISMMRDLFDMDDDTPETPMTHVSCAGESRQGETGQHAGYRCGQVPTREISADSEGEEDEDVDKEVENDRVDLSPLAYARQNGLTTDYFNCNPMKSICITSPPEEPLQDLDCTTLPGQAMEAAKTVARDADRERWTIDKETAEFITAVISLVRPDDVEVGEDVVRMSDFKIDEPVLSTDPELDLSRLRARNTVRSSTQGMQPCVLDSQKRESLAWSSEDLKLPSTMETSMISAGLPIDRETAELLKEAISPKKLDYWEMIEQAIDADQVRILMQCFPTLTLTDKQTRKLRRAATPLLLRSPSLSPGAIPPEPCEMELTSSPENLFAQEVAEVEAQLFEQDSRVNNGSNSSSALGDNASDHIQDLGRMPVTNSSSPLRQKRLRDIKVDTPLLHQDLESSPAKRAKTVSFPEELHTMIPEPETDDSTSDIELARRDAGVMEGVIKPMAQSVEDQISNERLDELDTTLRVDVPEVETAGPLPPGTNKSDEPAGQNHEILLSQIKNELPSEEKKWSSLSKIERMLSWSPFPRHLGKVSLDEQFDDGSCERYMAGLHLSDGDVDVEPLLWKKEGLRMLDAEESDDEELDVAVAEGEDENEQFANAASAAAIADAPAQAIKPVTQTRRPVGSKPSSALSGMQALLQKRKLELEAPRKPTASLAAEVAATAEPKTAASHDRIEGGSSINLTSGGLNGFLGLQGKHSLRAPSQDLRVLKSVQKAAVEPMPEQLMFAMEFNAAPSTLPSPSMPDPTEAVSLVMSSSMMANRQVVREVQSLLPALDIIERDPSNLAPRGSRAVGIHEADITISSSTGLMCTSLQKLKQRPLPGQTNFFGVRERIAAISPRYENLMVVVVEGNQDGFSPIRALDERDAAAINDLIGHVMGMDTNVEVCYVAGGDKDLAKWIAASICHHTYGSKETKLLQDETLWERLLRTAGANPALAQMVLAKLKRSDTIDGSEYGDASGHGLPAFVQMPAKERHQRFGPLMGGERVLQRVCSVLDQGWKSASRQ